VRVLDEVQCSSCFLLHFLLLSHICILNLSLHLSGLVLQLFRSIKFLLLFMLIYWDTFLKIFICY
jgi:hypothetical protein